VLNSGKTVIQHIYDTHNEGVERVKDYLKKWLSLKGKIDTDRFDHVAERIRQQVIYAEEWRDSVNSYFMGLSGIEDRNK
jgi:alpha-glucuronidase